MNIELLEANSVCLFGTNVCGKHAPASESCAPYFHIYTFNVNSNGSCAVGRVSERMCKQEINEKKKEAATASECFHGANACHMFYPQIHIQNRVRGSMIEMRVRKSDGFDAHLFLRLLLNRISLALYGS